MNKKDQVECPYHDIKIIIGSGLPTRYCGLFFDEKECIFGYYPDAGECSYFLFPEDTPAYKLWKQREEENVRAQAD